MKTLIENWNNIKNDIKNQLTIDVISREVNTVNNFANSKSQ